jgi:hypothetical protein
MFDAEGDIAALVYGADQDPDAILCDFAADLNAHGYRAVACSTSWGQQLTPSH